MSTLQQLNQQIAQLKEEIAQRKRETAELKEPVLVQVSRDAPRAPPLQWSSQKQLIGHFQKIYSCAWSPNNQKVLSACQDSRLIIWNARNSLKNHVVTLNSAWVMSCAYGPNNDIVGSGGLDNLLSLFRIGDDVKITEGTEIGGHDGFVSSIHFLKSSPRVLTTACDGVSRIFDITTQKQLSTFTGHEADVMYGSMHEDNNLLVTASIDQTCRLWDIRNAECLKTFVGHTNDVNTVAFSRDGEFFVSGSDDSTLRLFDIRSYAQLNRYDCVGANGVVSVDISVSGQYIFAAVDDNDNSIRVFDTLSGTEILKQTSIHERRIACCKVAPQGFAVLTGSWDTRLNIMSAHEKPQQ